VSQTAVVLARAPIAAVDRDVDPGDSHPQPDHSHQRVRDTQRPEAAGAVQTSLDVTPSKLQVEAQGQSEDDEWGGGAAYPAAVCEHTRQRSAGGGMSDDAWPPVSLHISLHIMQ
jgi:hypothetical protein